MEIMDYINPALLVIVPVLWIIGKIIKDATSMDNKHIPIILGAAGVVLAIVWVLATSDIINWQSALLAVFTAFVQGVLCAGLAVYGNQVLKQYTED